MLADEKIGQEINTVHKQSLSLEADHRKKSLDGCGGVLNTLGVANYRKERFLDPALAIHDLQDCLPRNQLDGALKGPDQAAIDNCDRHNNRNTQDDARDGKQGAQPVALKMAPGKKT